MSGGNVCQKEHPAEVIKQVLTVQRGQGKKHGRHQCAACAYELGRADAEQAARAAYEQMIEFLQAQIEQIRMSARG